MMKHNTAWALCFTFCLAVLATTTSAKDALPPLLVTSLSNLNQLQGFSADFSQTITYQNGTSNHYSGSIAIKRPGKFRWHYSKPYAQTYVSDGSDIWHYEPDLMHAVRMHDLGSVDPIAMQLLDGRISPQDISLISTTEPIHGNIRAFVVRIRKQIELTLTLDQQGQLMSISHVDLLGNNNHITLSNMVSKTPNEATFHFVPPKDIDILIEGE